MAIMLSPAAIKARELLEDPATTEVHFVGADRWSIRTGGTLRLLDYAFPGGENELVAWCNGLLIESGAAERLDGTTHVVEFSWRSPTVSARVHIVTQPVSPVTVVTIAKQAMRPISMSELVTSDMLSAEMAELLQVAIAGRLNLVISGGTGSGKTTFLNALLSLCDANERIGVIEEVPELRLPFEHAVYLYNRAVRSPRRVVEPGVLAGALTQWATEIAMAGEAGQAEVSLPRFIEWLGHNMLQIQGAESKVPVTLSSLVRESLRMRFDRIVVGEVRGAEVIDLLGAMNSGFSGSACTMHANAALDTVDKIQLLAAAHEAHFQPNYVLGLISQAVDLIIYLSPPELGQHRVGEILEVAQTPARADVVTHQRLFHYEPGVGFEREANMSRTLLDRLRSRGVFIGSGQR